jgi:predicted nucleotidyltransferase
MEVHEIREKIDSKDYNFLRENKHLGKNIILLTTGGSHAYGTDIPTSDLDIRGVFVEQKQEFWGLSNFEHFENRTTDTTIYSLKKMVTLLLNCNPNVIEILGTKPEHLFVITKEGQLLRDNISIFLSKIAFKSFGGYATAQLRRLQNALARDTYPQKEKEKHIMGSVLGQLTHLNDTDTECRLYLDKSLKKDFEEEIYIDMNLKHFPLRGLKAMNSDISNIIKDYESLNHRNSKKDDIHLNKHAMHLVRLLTMGTEILEGKGVNTYRSNDIELLIRIRNGELSYPEIFAMVGKLEKGLQYAVENTELPSKPNYEKVEELMIEIYKTTLE